MVVERDALDGQVVAAFRFGRMGFEECETFRLRTSEPFVELVQFHQDAGVAFIEAVSLLQCIHGLLRVIAFVVVSQREVAPYGGERWGDGGRCLPTCDGIVVLPCGIPEVAEGVGRFGAGFVVLFHRILQHQYFFDAVGEAVRMVILFGLFVIFERLDCVAFT